MLCLQNYARIEEAGAGDLFPAIAAQVFEQFSRPQYRLLIGEMRVFYDVEKQDVEVLAIVPKSKAAAWLKEMRAVE